MRKRHLSGTLAVTLSAVVLAACGSSTQTRTTLAAKLVPVPGSAAGKIVLSAVGAQRIGLAIATARSVAAPAPPQGNGKKTQPMPRAGRPTVTIPSSAVIYAPSGRTYAFISVGHLSFTEVRVIVAYMNGPTAYLRSGPRAGSRVVSRGAEELYGVQTGVLAQT
jgi:hypothetical protein